MAGAIPILKLGTTLLVTVHVDLDDAVAQSLQGDLLATIEHHSARGIVIDITGLDTVDSYVARILAETGRMAKLMGADTVLVGMRPEFAATLVRMGYAMTGTRTALSLEDGLAMLGQKLVSG